MTHSLLCKPVVAFNGLPKDSLTGDCQVVLQLLERAVEIAQCTELRCGLTHSCDCCRFHQMSCLTVNIRGIKSVPMPDNLVV